MARKSQNLVQVSTYAPLVDRLKLEALAEKEGKTLYAYVREVLQKHLAEQPEPETKSEDDLLKGTDGGGENLL